MRIKLTPSAGRTEVTRCETDADGNQVLRVKVTAVPEKGKANKALIALLAKEWQLGKSKLGIVTGQKDRNKIVSVAVDPAFFAEFFDKWVNKFN